MGQVYDDSIFQYLREFGPKDWGKCHPFPFELSPKAVGTELTPRWRDRQLVCRKLERIKDVRRRRDGTYVVGRRNEQETPRDFYWFALRGFHDSTCMNVWIFLHSVLNSRDCSTSAEEIANLSGSDPTSFGKWLDILVNEDMATKKGGRYFIKTPDEFALFCRSSAPKPINEVVMDFLCTNHGSSKGSVCKWMKDVNGCTISATYRAIKDLEKGSFVKAKPVKHPGKRGPASENLQVLCKNCFFLFCSKEECLDFQVSTFGENVKNCFGRELRDEEKASLKEFAKAHPEGSQLLRKLNEILTHFQRLKKGIDKEKYLHKAILFLRKELGLSLSLL